MRSILYIAIVFLFSACERVNVSEYESFLVSAIHEIQKDHNVATDMCLNRQASEDIIYVIEDFGSVCDISYIDNSIGSSTFRITMSDSHVVIVDVTRVHSSAGDRVGILGVAYRR